MGSVLPWLGEAVVPHFVSDIDLTVRGLLVVEGFTTFRASLELLLREGESRSQVLMQLFQVLMSGVGGDKVQVTRCSGNIIILPVIIVNGGIPVDR